MFNKKMFKSFSSNGTYAVAMEDFVCFPAFVLTRGLYFKTIFIIWLTDFACCDWSISGP